MGQKMGAVLCVDDEPGILRSLKWLLQKEFDVTTAASGHEALALVGQSDFDVIISDQRMPGMTGVEFLREACRMAPRAMRILLTGYSDLEAVTRSVNESEIYRFINKPWHVDELPKVVAEAARIAQGHPAPQAITPPPEHHEADEAMAPEQVLVIDDSPQIAESLRQVLGAKATVVHAASLAEAIDDLAGQPEIGVIVSDTSVGGADATRLLKLLKEKCPGIVTIALSSRTDAEEIISLINHGQVYRFLQKPVKAGYLKLMLTSALLKRQQLRENPEILKRHSVLGMAKDVREAFAGELQRMAASPSPRREAAGRSADNDGSWLNRITSGFRLLFG
jgi:DNA-binding NtrC family response regulator